MLQEMVITPYSVEAWKVFEGNDVRTLPKVEFLALFGWTSLTQ